MNGAAAVFALINITNPTKEALLDDLQEHLVGRRGFAVATVNLDHVVKLSRDSRFRDAYVRHTHVVADGNPIVWLQQIAGRHVNLVTGSDLVEPIVALAAELDVPVGLLGSTSTILEFAAANLTQKNPTLQIVARIAPSPNFNPFGAEADRCLKQLKASGARLCLVALGAPKQEILAVRGREILPDCGFISVGAGLSFIAGTQRRAPRWMRRLALEWFWRLANERTRLAGRYRDCALILPSLVAWALRERSRHDRMPSSPQGDPK
jgi:exopolysaccharide biosynthesis WecB/TagA/CpsF family protein